MDEQTNTPPVRGVLDHIGDLKSKKIEGSALSIEQRHEVVEYLQAEGVSTVEISRLLGMTSRTIRRYTEAIRQNNAMEADPKLLGLLVGEFVTEARSSVSRIKRAMREKNTPLAVRIEGELAIFQIYDGLSSRLQSLGHLPSATLRLQADLTHNLGEVLGYAELAQELDRLKEITPESSPQADGLHTLKELTDKAARLDPEAEKCKGEEHS